MTSENDFDKKDLLENDKITNELRDIFFHKEIFVINVVSSPGSGKTSLLEKTIQNLNKKLRIALIVGNLQNENDTERLINAGAIDVKPILTDGKCHLDAQMIKKSIESFDLNNIDLVIIENVGNLICPANFDLGEDMKIVMISTTDGDDKPIKYPIIFRRSMVMVINKLDLLGMSEFELHKLKENALKINGQLRIFDISCQTGEGLTNWYYWLEEQVKTKKNF